MKKNAKNGILQTSEAYPSFSRIFSQRPIHSLYSSSRPFICSMIGDILPNLWLFCYRFLHIAPIQNSSPILDLIKPFYTQTPEPSVPIPSRTLPFLPAKSTLFMLSGGALKPHQHLELSINKMFFSSHPTLFSRLTSDVHKVSKES